jgi:RNA polymerase sigma-70 factor, ECF subfamily
VDSQDEVIEGLEERLKNGDREALSLLFSQQWSRLWRIVDFRMDRRLFGRVDPDDVLQEAYLAAADRLVHYQKETTLSPLVWVRMILMQTLTDIHRHHLGAQMRDAGREIDVHEFHYPQSTAVSLAAILAGNFTSPSQAVVRTEMLEQVEKAIEAMDPLDREVLALRHFEELGNKEVAEVLGIQQKAASIRYVRALKRLKDIVARMPGFLEGDRHGPNR